MKYDAIVIGSGQAGNPLIYKLADKGWTVALIEKEHLGGTCINTGCTPTKTMVMRAQVAYYARNAARWGVHTGEVRVDLPAIVAQKERVVQSFRSGLQHKVDSRENLHLYRGQARFTGPHRIAVGDKVLESDKIFINTGTRPTIPGIPGLAAVPYLTNAGIMELHELPEHLIVLGGGYIGLEFGQMFQRFGSQVTIVQRAPQLVPREDADVAEEIRKILCEDGVEVLLNTKAASAEPVGDGRIRLVVQNGGSERALLGSHLLLAAGRSPNSEALNLGAAGVETDKNGFIKVNERLETSAPGVYALGDVKGGPAFTHISYDDFRIIRTNLLEGGHATIRDRLVPNTVFIDPQLGRIGLSETEARARGGNIRVAKMPMNYVARALEMDEARGFMKAVVDADTGLILGAAVLGIEGGELMAALELAMLGKLPYTVLRDAVFAHPTLAESFNNLFATLTP